MVILLFFGSRRTEPLCFSVQQSYASKREAFIGHKCVPAGHGHVHGDETMLWLSSFSLAVGGQSPYVFLSSKAMHQRGKYSLATNVCLQDMVMSMVMKQCCGSHPFLLGGWKAVACTHERGIKDSLGLCSNIGMCLKLLFLGPCHKIT